MLNAPPTSSDSSDAANCYDDIPYESQPISQSHPSRLYVVGRLFGLNPTPVARCRVLELGCASGGNLIPMAEMFPDSEFVGVDYSKRQIDDGRKFIERLGLQNLSLRHASIMDVDSDYGMFDYVICHGVYSWVPSDVQNKILAICRERLNTNGIAYVSYNTYPGWHMRGMIRDMMKYHANQFPTPQLRIANARKLLEFLAQSVKKEGPYSQLLTSELELLRPLPDYYIYHEHLEDHNEPLYFHQFNERAKAANLKYLGESSIRNMVTGNFGPEIDKTLQSLASDQIQIEQYMDFLRSRTFRETLLVHGHWKPKQLIEPEYLNGLHIASHAIPSNPPDNVVSNDNVLTGEAVRYNSKSGSSGPICAPLVKVAIRLLNEVFPGTLPFDELRRKARETLGGDVNDPQVVREDTRTLGVEFLRCYLSSDLIEIHGIPISFERKPSDRPRATKWARVQATDSFIITNLRHELQRLNDLERRVVPLCDGQNDREQIVEGLTQAALAGRLNVQKDNVPLRNPDDVRQAINSVIETTLQTMAIQGLLVG